MTSDSPTPAPDTLWFGFDCATERIFFTAKEAPQRIAVPDEILALRMMERATDEDMEHGDPNYNAKLRAAELHRAGVVIDAQVDIYQWDPWKTMRDRRNYNYDDVPDAFNKDTRIMVPPEDYFAAAPPA